MTLCIAALCQDDGDRKVVFSFDRRVETAIASAEIEFKFKWVSNLWAVLLADDIALARELISYYEPVLGSNERSINDANVLEHLYEPLNKLRHLEADRLVRRLHAMSYADFLQNGKTYLPDELFRQTCYEIANQRLNVELILMGWFNSRFNLFKVYCGKVYRCEPFVAIGAGTDIAEPSLFKREHLDTKNLAITMYSVYEAQRLGETAPGVGRRFEIGMLCHSDVDDDIYIAIATAKARSDFLAEKFKEFGPKPIASDLVLPDGALWYPREVPKQLPLPDPTALGMAMQAMGQAASGSESSDTTSKTDQT